MRAWLSVYLKGVAMGAADIVPGVSGGTIALIVGIYDRLVAAIASLDPRILGHLRNPRDREAQVAFVHGVRRMDLPFLFVLGLGIATAVLVVSRVILAVFEAYPAHINAFFFGLIGASVVVIGRDVELTTPGRAIAGIVGVVLAFVVAGLASGNAIHSLPILFVAGAIAISAMLLPGISGAAFLYILGQYEFLLEALRTTVDGILAVDTSGETLEASIHVATFLVGAVLGLLTTAHVVSWALARYRHATMIFLVSLMLGALRLPVEEIHATTGVPGPVTAIGLLATAGIGMLAVLALDRATGSLEYV